MVKKVILLCAIGLLLNFAPLHLFSVTVDWVSGDVTYSHLKSDWKELDVGMKLSPGDIVKTGLGSETTLIDDGTEVFILENSTFTVSEKYENDVRKAGFMLFLGRMKLKLSRVREDEPEIRTQTVNMTIRGTEFEVGSGYDGSTLVVLTDGVVVVRGKSKELVLQGGEGTEVAFGEEPVEKFEVMTRVIDWDEWLTLSKKSIKGKELELLGRILGKFKEINYQISDYERIREEALQKKDEYIRIRDELAEEGKTEEATKYSKEAGTWSKRSIHALVNIRFLALSSIGLYDMSQMIYTGVEKPEKPLIDTFEEIKTIYEDIERRYIFAGDRERLEEKARKKKGCLKLF